MSNIKGTIPNIYKRQLLDVMLFSFILGQKSAVPSCSVQSAIENFKTRYSMSEDDLAQGTAIQTYQRMNKELARSESSKYSGNKPYIFCAYKKQFLKNAIVGYVSGQSQLLPSRFDAVIVDELLSFLGVGDDELTRKEAEEYCIEAQNMEQNGRK